MKAIVTMHKAEKYAFSGKECPEELHQFFFMNFGCARKVYNLCTAFLYEKLEDSGYAGGGPLPDIKIPEVSVFKKRIPLRSQAPGKILSRLLTASTNRMTTRHIQNVRSEGRLREPSPFRSADLRVCRVFTHDQKVIFPTRPAASILQR